jgi:hypothetical protein
MRIDRAPRDVSRLHRRLPVPTGVPRTIDAPDERGEVSLSASRKRALHATPDRHFDDSGDFG